MIARLGPVSLLALSLALSPSSWAQEEEPPPSDAATEARLPSESEPEPFDTVEQVGEPSVGTDSALGADESSESSADDDADRSDEPEPPQGEPAAEVFVPTEEISEDFAVPFPVDI